MAAEHHTGDRTMRGNETERFVMAMSEMLSVRGLPRLSEDERFVLEGAFDDAVNAKVEAFWNEQHRTRD
jgi:hypothetical protein